MVVDDAVVVRGLIARWVESEPGLEVVAALRSGREAIAQIEHVNPDVVILDVDMPDMDGITALPRLLAILSLGDLELEAFQDPARHFANDA